MSGALALFNIVPCYALDGQWVFKVRCHRGQKSLDVIAVRFFSKVTLGAIFKMAEPDITLAVCSVKLSHNR